MWLVRPVFKLLCERKSLGHHRQVMERMTVENLDERQQMLGYVSLAEVPAEQLDGKSERIQHYFNAVYCWARAMLNERYQDYDATASGVKRGEELAESSGDLWRDARWAISRVQDAPHCTVELI